MNSWHRIIKNILSNFYQIELQVKMFIACLNYHIISFVNDMQECLIEIDGAFSFIILLNFNTKNYFE